MFQRLCLGLMAGLLLSVSSLADTDKTSSKQKAQTQSPSSESVKKKTTIQKKVMRQDITKPNIKDLISGTRLSTEPEDLSGAFLLNVTFTIGVEGYSGSKKTYVDDWMEIVIDMAEAKFNTAPRLIINETFTEPSMIGDRPLGRLEFENRVELDLFMDEYFDVFLRSQTDGDFHVLVVDEICVGYEDDNTTRSCATGGNASLPKWMSLLTRRRGIIVRYKNSTNTLAHEFGHLFSLIHTFDPDVHIDGNMRCNSAFTSDACSSCINGELNEDETICFGEVNIMDYCKPEDQYSYYINQCQVDRAVKQREKYMTSSGEVDYFKLKGDFGTPACTKDTECETAEYCHKGFSGFGTQDVQRQETQWRSM